MSTASSDYPADHDIEFIHTQGGMPEWRSYETQHVYTNAFDTGAYGFEPQFTDSSNTLHRAQLGSNFDRLQLDDSWYEPYRTEEFSSGHEGSAYDEHVPAATTLTSDTNSHIPSYKDAMQEFASLHPCQNEHVPSTSRPNRPKPLPRVYKNRIRPAGWHQGIDKDKLVRLYESIYSRWGNIEPKIFEQCGLVLSQILRRREDVRNDLLNGDSATLELIAHRTSPEEVLKRSRAGSNAIDSSQKSNSAWLAAILRHGEADFIIKRLAEHWHLPIHTVKTTLTTYAKYTGCITSPEPLLDDDSEIFCEAAQVIEEKSQKPNRRQSVPILCDDILHQTSNRYLCRSFKECSKYTEFLFQKSRAGSYRFECEPWHIGRNHHSISAIHAAVAQHWMPGMERPALMHKIDYVNVYLQEHQDLIPLIESGDTMAAYQVADACMRKKAWMKQPA